MQNSLRRARPLLGTFVEISVPELPGHELDAVIDEAFEAIARVHHLMSFHDIDSDVSRLNREAAAQPVRVHPWTLRVLQAALELRDRSSGVFDVSVAPVLQELGLLPDHKSATSIGPPSGNAFNVTPDGRIRFQDSGVRIDLGGIAKGFAVDRAAEILQDRGIASGIVNAGGDLVAFGPDSHQVYIRNPNDPNGPMCPVCVRNEALASTGPRYDPFCSFNTSGCAVIDPRSRTQVQNVRGATVRQKSCIIADALTKVAMIAGERATTTLEYYDASALLVFANGDVLVTPNWKGTGALAA